MEDNLTTNDVAELIGGTISTLDIKPGTIVKLTIPMKGNRWNTPRIAKLAQAVKQRGGELSVVSADTKLDVAATPPPMWNPAEGSLLSSWLMAGDADENGIVRWSKEFHESCIQHVIQMENRVVAMNDVLKRAEHTLQTEQGLKAFDGAAPGETFEIEHKLLLEQIEVVLA